MVSFVHTSLLLCVFVATRAFAQSIFSESDCPDKHCSLGHLDHTKSEMCLEVNNEIVYKCQKFKCVMAASGSDYTLQPVKEIGCIYGQHKRCYPQEAILERECHTYTCVKKKMSPYSNTELYRFRNTGPPRCKDYYGYCRRPGEVSSYEMDGRIHENCVCRQVSTVMVKFDCND